MFDSVISMASYMMGSLVDAHTYVGIFLGVVFAPLWTKIWTFGSSYIVKKFPVMGVVFDKISSMASAFVKLVTPVAKEVEKKIDEEQAK
jgi:hypothetical protein